MKDASEGRIYSFRLSLWKEKALNK